MFRSLNKIQYPNEKYVYKLCRLIISFPTFKYTNLKRVKVLYLSTTPKSDFSILDTMQNVSGNSYYTGISLKDVISSH